MGGLCYPNCIEERNPVELLYQGTRYPFAYHIDLLQNTFNQPANMCKLVVVYC
jgi:hypothetical protein